MESRYLTDIFEEVALRASDYVMPTCYDANGVLGERRLRFAADMTEYIEEQLKPDPDVLKVFRHVFSELSYAIPCVDYEGATEVSVAKDKSIFRRYVYDYLFGYFCATKRPEENEDSLRYDVAELLGFGGNSGAQDTAEFCESVSRDYNDVVKPIVVENRVNPIYAEPVFLRARTNSWLRRHIFNPEFERQNNLKPVERQIARQDREEENRKKLQRRQKMQMTGEDYVPIPDYVRNPDYRKNREIIEAGKVYDEDLHIRALNTCIPKILEARGNIPFADLPKTEEEKQEQARCELLTLNRLRVRKSGGVKTWKRELEPIKSQKTRAISFGPM